MNTPQETLIVACLIVALVLCSHVGVASALLIVLLCGIFALLGGGTRDAFRGAPHRREASAFAMKSSTDEFAEGEQTPNPRREVDGREVGIPLV